MSKLIRHQFESLGDLEKIKDSSWTIYFFWPFCPTCLIFQAWELVSRSSTISWTWQLAQTYTDEVKNVLQNLPPSKAWSMLEVLVDRIVMMGDQLISGCREAEKYQMPTNKCPSLLPLSSAISSWPPLLSMMQWVTTRHQRCTMFYFYHFLLWDLFWIFHPHVLLSS